MSVGSSSIWLIHAAISAESALLVSQAFLRLLIISCNSSAGADPAQSWSCDEEVSACSITVRWTLLIDLVSRQSTIVRLEFANTKRSEAIDFSHLAIVANSDLQLWRQSAKLASYLRSSSSNLPKFNKWFICFRFKYRLIIIVSIYYFIVFNIVTPTSDSQHRAAFITNIYLSPDSSTNSCTPSWRPFLWQSFRRPKAILDESATVAQFFRKGMHFIEHLSVW